MVFILSLGIIVTLAILTDNPFITSAAELVFMIVIPTHICYLRSPRDWKSAKYLIVFLALSTIGIVAGFYLQHYRYHTGFLTVQSTSGSMEPTFLENDFSIVNNFAYRRAAAQRGDIITFKKPTNQYPSYWTQADLQQIPDLLCKRVVGMEGDYVELTQDCIRVNGKIFRTIPKEQLWDEPQWRTDPNTWPYRTCRVPKGCCYVVGDHYFNSADSRTFGPIKNDTVLGKVVKTFWPLSRARLLMKH